MIHLQLIWPIYSTFFPKHANCICFSAMCCSYFINKKNNYNLPASCGFLRIEYTAHCVSPSATKMGVSFFTASQSNCRFPALLPGLTTCGRRWTGNDFCSILLKKSFFNKKKNLHQFFSHQKLMFIHLTYYLHLFIPTPCTAIEISPTSSKLSRHDRRIQTTEHRD